MSHHIEVAEVALMEHRSAAAEEALLAAWRESKDPLLAKVLDVLATHLTSALGSFDVEDANFHESWLDIANARRSSDVGRLLEVWAQRPLSALRERVGRLAQFADDPRIARALTAFVSRVPSLNTTRTPMWTAAFALLERVGDVRSLAPMIARQAAGTNEGLFESEVLRPGLSRVIAALKKIVVQPVSPAAIDRLFPLCQ